MVKILLDDRTPVTIDNMQISLTYSGIIVGYPDESINANIISFALETLEKKSKAKPYIINPLIKQAKFNNKWEKKINVKDSYPILPESIITCVLMHDSKTLRLPVMWFDTIDENMRILEIIEKSGIKTSILTSGVNERIALIVSEK